jgi:hypothetical protein
MRGVNTGELGRWPKPLAVEFDKPDRPRILSKSEAYRSERTAKVQVARKEATCGLLELALGHFGSGLRLLRSGGRKKFRPA